MIIPNIYSIGKDNNEIPVYESVLSYSDDWENITDDFELVNSASVYVANNTAGSKSDLNIMLSKKRAIIYFNCDRAVRLNFPSAIPFDNSWKRGLFYKGNDFETLENGGTINPVPNDFLYPKDVYRGSNLYQMNTIPGTTRDFCVIGYVGSTISDSGFACKKVINNGDNSTGFYVGQTCFSCVIK